MWLHWYCILCFEPILTQNLWFAFRFKGKEKSGGWPLSFLSAQTQRILPTYVFDQRKHFSAAHFPQWWCKLLTGWSDDSETIVAQCHPKTQGHGHRWAGPQSRLMISWSPKYKIARSPKYDRPSCPTKILDIVTPGFSPFHRLSSLKKTIILYKF